MSTDDVKQIPIEDLSLADLIAVHKNWGSIKSLIRRGSISKEDANFRTKCYWEINAEIQKRLESIFETGLIIEKK